MMARDASGYGFIELLAALGLLAILILVAVPRLVLPDTLNTSVLAHQVAVDLRLTRQFAIGRRVMYTLEFSPATPPYTSYTVRNESTLVEEPDFPKAIPGGITVTGRRSYSFAVGGWIDDDGTGPGSTGTDGSTTMAAGTDSFTVQVFWYNGRVKVVQP